MTETIEEKIEELDRNIKNLIEKENKLKEELYTRKENEYKNLIGKCFADYNLYFPIYYKINGYKNGIFQASKFYLINDQRQFYMGIDEFTPARLENFRRIKRNEYFSKLEKSKLKIEKWK